MKIKAADTSVRIGLGAVFGAIGGVALVIVREWS